MKKIFSFLFFALLFSCTKPGTGGKGSIKGAVKHHDKPIPGSVVYIKYGAKESPGTDVTYYDESANTDANANYEFPDLKKGAYYLFAIGFDTAIGKPVSGGVPVVIKSKTETVESNVLVTE